MSRKPTKHEKTNLWSSVSYMALARCFEAFPDEEAARSYLLAHIETLRRSVQPENGICCSITPQPDGGVTGQGSRSHYSIMAYRRCFAYGVKNACWKNGQPTCFQIHSANGAPQGNVFMVVDSKLRSESK